MCLEPPSFFNLVYSYRVKIRYDQYISRIHMWWSIWKSIIFYWEILSGSHFTKYLFAWGKSESLLTSYQFNTTHVKTQVLIEWKNPKNRVQNTHHIFMLASVLLNSSGHSKQTRQDNYEQTILLFSVDIWKLLQKIHLMYFWQFISLFYQQINPCMYVL